MSPGRISVREFEQLLRYGHGRPLFYLTNHDPARYLKVMEHACLTDQRYDKQVEEVRTSYLLELIRLSGHQERLKQKILAQLTNLRPGAPSEQLFTLSVSMARQGEEYAANIVRGAVRRLAESKDFWNVNFAIEIDGIDGMLPYLSDYFQSRNKDNDWLFGSWVSDLEESDGDEQAWAKLRAAASHNPAIEAALQSELSERANRQAHNNDFQNRQYPPYSEVKRIIQAGKASDTGIQRGVSRPVIATS